MKVRFVSGTTDRFTFCKVYILKDIGDCYVGFDDNDSHFYSWYMKDFGDWEIIGC